MASLSNDTATEIITRVLFVTPLVHVYAIPPLQSNRGHVAAVWTSSPQNEIFTARLRVIETSDPSADLIPPQRPVLPKKTPLNVEILLEDPKTSELFAGAPYVHASIVEPTIDSSRFFAIRVTGEGGRKALLGMGFEERTDALDFSICLQEARKILGLEIITPATPKTPSTPSAPVTPRTPGLAGARGARPVPGRTRPDPVAVPAAGASGIEEQSTPVKRDWSFKEGQMLTVDLSGKIGGLRSAGSKDGIEPPSGGGLKSATGGGFALLPPPPSAKEVREDQRSHTDEAKQEKTTLEELGFDDGEFGEFQ